MQNIRLNIPKYKRLKAIRPAGQWLARVLPYSKTDFSPISLEHPGTEEAERRGHIIKCMLVQQILPRLFQKLTSFWATVVKGNKSKQDSGSMMKDELSLLR